MKALQQAVDTKRALLETATIEASQARDKLASMEGKRELRWQKEMEAVEKTQKADYDTRRKVMDDAKTEYNTKKARRDQLDTSLAAIDA